MDTIQVPPRNRYTGAAADALLVAKRGADKYEVKDWVPLLGGTGLGDLFMGKAPELADDVSYQGLNALFRGGNLATGGIGTYGLDPRTVDAAFLGADALGVGKLSKYLAQKGAQKLTDGVHDVSRREFMKKSAALGGATALGTVGLGALRKVGQESRKGAVNAATGVAPKYRYNSLSEYNDYLDDVADSEASIARAEHGIWSQDPDAYSGNYLFDPAKQKQRLAKEEADMYFKAKQSANSFGGREAQIKHLEGRLATFKPGTYDYNEYATAIAKLKKDNTLNAFSPKAKAEMKAFKQRTNDYADLEQYLGRPSNKQIVIPSTTTLSNIPF